MNTGVGDFNPEQWLHETGSEASSNEEDFNSKPSNPESSEARNTSASKCPFSGREFKQSEAANMQQLVFGAGTRRCPGQNIGTMAIVTLLVVLCREVKEIRMSQEEQDRPLCSVFPHPTGLPVQLIPRQ